MTLREVMQCSLDTPISQTKSDIRRVHLAVKSIAKLISSTKSVEMNISRTSLSMGHKECMYIVHTG
jgi:hypothetical protein